MERKTTETDGSKTEREPYETPRIVYREPLEAMAGVCDPEANGKTTAAACLVPGS